MPHTLKTARRRAGFNVSELARKAGVDRSTIQRLESGQCRPSFDTVTSLEKALGLKRGGLTFNEESHAA